MNFPAAEILFVSDSAAELDAAAVAGLKTTLSIRQGNAPFGEQTAHPRA